MSRPRDSVTLLRCLRLILRPVICFCVRHALKVQDLLECAKTVFIEVSSAELQKRGTEITQSRLSIMTGLHRRDVTRLVKGDARLESGHAGGLTTKIIGQWLTDKRFSKRGKEPRMLTVGTEDSEFAELVRTVSRDLNSATVLFELERVGAVQVAEGRLKLVQRAYIPKGDPVGGFKVLADDCADLISVVEHNVFQSPEIPHLHLRTSYDRVRGDAVPEIQRWLLREGYKFHARARDFIAKFDQDINPRPTKREDEVQVTLGGFSNFSKKT